MSKEHLPQANVDPKLLEELNAVHEVDYSRKYMIPISMPGLNRIDDRHSLYTTIPTYRYGNKLILSDEGVYLLNRLYAYYRDYSGVAHLNDWHHVHALIKTYPMLQELWEQFETALALCDEHEKVKRGKL